MNDSVFPRQWRLALVVCGGFLLVNSAQAAEANIESALQTLLADVDLTSFVDARREDEMASGQYRIRVGDTLDGILNRAFPDTPIRREFLRQAFVRANPRAFRRGNPNWMLAGVTVRIPAAEDLMNVIFEDAAALDPRAAQRHWIRYP